MENRYRLFVLGILLALSSARADRMEPRSFGGTTNLVDKRMLAITGRLAGCTGTVVSPPKVSPVVVLTASHCRMGAQTMSLPSGPITVTCVGNKDWKESTGEDVALCVGEANKSVPAEVSGCISTKKEPAAGTKLLSVGYGNPRWNGPQLRTPQGLRSTVASIIQQNRVIVARTHGGYVTPGDSGGPAFEEAPADAKALYVAGVNSKHMGTSQAAYSPVSTAPNKDFFNRAVKHFEETTKKSIKVCGVNWEPSSTPGRRGTDDPPAPPRVTDRWLAHAALGPHTGAATH